MPGDPLRAQVDRRDVPRRRPLLHRGPRDARLHRHLARPAGLGPGLRAWGSRRWRSTSTSCSREYDVQSVVRVGSCGALTETLALRDVVIASGACTDSSMNRIAFEGLDYAPVADFGLLRARRRGRRAAPRRRDAHVGLLFSSDSFYAPAPELDRAGWWSTACSPSRWRPARSTRSPRSTAAGRWRSAPSPTTSSPARRPPPPSASRPSARWSRSRSPPRCAG